MPLMVLANSKGIAFKYLAIPVINGQIFFTPVLTISYHIRNEANIIRQIDQCVHEFHFIT